MDKPTFNEPRRIIAFGATSEIARWTLRCFADEGSHLVLIGRDAKKLEQLERECLQAGATSVVSRSEDLTDCKNHKKLWAWAKEKLENRVNIVFIAHGQFLNQTKTREDYETAHQEILCNYLSVVSLITESIHDMKSWGHKCSYAVISSVAGERGRKDAYNYASTKAALNTYLQGLRSYLSTFGVCVTSILPGWTTTPMTAHMKQNFLFATAEKVGRSTYNAIVARKSVAYTPWFWRWIMFLIRMLPESVKI